MKVKLFNYENELEITSKNVTIIEIDNKQLYRKLINNLRLQLLELETDEQLYIYDDNFRKINSNRILYISDILNPMGKIDVRKIILESLICKQDLFSHEVNEINKQLSELVNNIINEVNFELKYQSVFSFKDLFSFYKFQTIDYNNIIDNLYSTFDFIAEFKRYDIIIIIGMKNYFESDELIEIYRYCIAHDLKLISIENSNSIELLKYEQKLHIDELFENHYEEYTD